MKRVWHSILAIFATTFVVGAAVPLCTAAKENDKDKGKKADPTGSYTATVAGYFKGEGNASANGNKISITADVTDENGTPGKFTATDLTVDATNHFTGTGTAMGLSLKLSGRVDAGGQDSAIKTKRFVCTFKTSKDSQHAEEHHGRVVGFVDLTSSSVTPVTDGGITGGGEGGDGGGGGGGGGGDGTNPPPPHKGAGGGGGGGGDDHGGRGGNHRHPHRGGGGQDR
jgi:hypothetical protein